MLLFTTKDAALKQRCTLMLLCSHSTLSPFPSASSLGGKYCLETFAGSSRGIAPSYENAGPVEGVSSLSHWLCGRILSCPAGLNPWPILSSSLFSQWPTNFPGNLLSPTQLHLDNHYNLDMLSIPLITYPNYNGYPNGAKKEKIFIE